MRMSFLLLYAIAFIFLPRSFFKTIHNSLQHHVSTAILKIKPILIIHVGPGKTGTSFLQSILGSHLGRTTLLKDNYLYIGACFQNLPGCVQLKKAFEVGFQYVPEFQESLDKMRSMRLNGIFIFEGSASDLASSMPYLDDFDVRVVSNYRRMYEMLPSGYGQKYATKVKNESRKTLKRYCADLIPLAFEDYVFNTEKDFENLGIMSRECQDFLSSEFERLIRPSLLNKVVETAGIHVHNWIDLYEPIDDNIVGNALLVKLFCSGIVPGTKLTCFTSKNGFLESKVTPKANSRHSVAISRLAMEAMRQKVAYSHSENFFRNKLMEEVDFADFPKNCMKQEKLDMLLNVSWMNEVAVFPEREGDTGRQSLHSEAFQEYVKNGAYCSIDIDYALQELLDKFLSWSHEEKV